MNGESEWREFRSAAENARITAEAEAQARLGAEERARREREERALWEQLADEAEQAKLSLAAQLQTLQAAAATASPLATAAIISQAEDAAAAIDIDEAATRIREEVDQNANIIVGATFDESLEGIVRVSVVATGIDNLGTTRQTQPAGSLTELAVRLRNDIADQIERNAPPPQLKSPQLRPAARHPEIRLAKSTSEYARPAAPRGLDPCGRTSAVRNLIEEKVLHIPAFLGRKAN